MKRRSFFAVLAGLFTIPFVSKITASKPLTFKGHPIIFDSPPKAFSAQRHLNYHYAEFFRRHKTGPSVILVSPWLFDLFESELTANQRFIPADALPVYGTALCFKGCTLIKSPVLKGLEVCMGATVDEAVLQG